MSMIKALGGDTTPMACVEAYKSLLQGVIDGAENNWPSFEVSRHFEAAINVCVSGLNHDIVMRKGISHFHVMCLVIKRRKA